MAKILADKDIHRLIGSVIIDADINLLNPNGIELRLGNHVHFHSTSEELRLNDGEFLKVNPGETVTIVSKETIDFRAKSVQQIFPDVMLMGLITPTTTMMREGISQVTTKIDAGFHGVLNWGLRNGSIKELILQHGEPIFKLTIFSLSEDESPDKAYGERLEDSYQDSGGIMRSNRKIPADIPKSKIISSGFSKLDPKKQLKEAGYPFDHIGTELVDLHGKFEIVSTEVKAMKDEFHKRTTELTEKIDDETNTLSEKIEDTRTHILEKVEYLFDKKFMRIIGILIGAATMLYGGITYLQETNLGGNTISFIAAVIGIVILIVSFQVGRRIDQPNT